MERVVRYFVLPENQITGHRASLVPDGDFLPISNLKVIRYPYPTDDGRYIVKVELPPYLIKDMAESCADYGIDDPLTLEGVVVLDIANSYVGVTRQHVLKRFPELDGYVEVDGERYLKFSYKIWAFESK